MAREQSVLLDVGDVFPAIEVPTVAGTLLKFPADLAGKWTTLIIYRGDW